jgi:hypothetical protein
VNAPNAETVPVVEATREAERHHNTIVWVVRRCCFCQRRHTHLADPVMTSVIIPARCSPNRFYQVREVPR